MKTKMGDITVHFTPEYSGPESIQYVLDVVDAVVEKRGGVCDKCECDFFCPEECQSALRIIC